MKLFMSEMRRQLNRKFVVTLILATLFTFGVSAYQSYENERNLSDTIDMRIMEIDMQIEMSEENQMYASDTEDSEEQSVLELDKEIIAYKRSLKTAYEAGDKAAIIENRLQIRQAELEQASLGIRFSNRQEIEQESELLSILTEKGITAYRDPLLPLHDGVNSIDFLLGSYMRFLLPIIVMLIGADSISTERHSGSIKRILATSHSRFSVFTAKYFTSSALSTLVILASVVATFIGGSLFLGMGDFRYPVKAKPSLFETGSDVFVSSWVVQLQAILVLLCAVLFFSALAMLVSTLFRHGAFSLCVGALGAAGAVFLNRQMVISQKGGPLRYLPFDLSDGYAASVGKISVSIQEKVSAGGGVIASQDSGRFLIINNPFPGIFACVILLFCAALCFTIAAIIFNRQDVT